MEKVVESTNERENWVRLCLLREAAVSHARENFRDLFHALLVINPSGEPWEGSPENGIQLWSIIKQLKRQVHFEPQEEAYINTGELGAWELQILAKISQVLGIPDYNNQALLFKNLFSGILKESSCNNRRFEQIKGTVVNVLRSRCTFDSSQIFRCDTMSAENHLKVVDIIRKGNMVRIFKKNMKKAIQVFGEAVKFAVDDNDAVLLISTVLKTIFELALTDKESAKEDGPMFLTLAERRVEVEPQSWQSHYDLGRVHQLLGNEEQALVALKEARKLNPTRSDIELLIDDLKQVGNSLPYISLEKALEQMKGDTGSDFPPCAVLHSAEDNKKSKNKTEAALGYVIEGRCYEDGYGGVKRNTKKAIECFEKAADLGDPTAICQLARLYRDGRGLKKDFKKSAELLQRAIKVPCLTQENCFQFSKLPGDPHPGIAEALNELGKYYDGGIWYPKNERIAFIYFKRALDAGHLEAALYIGKYYDQGLIMERNSEKAVQYWKMAADAGSGHAMYMLSVCAVENGDIQIGRDWKLRAEELGYPKSAEEDEGFEVLVNSVTNNLKILNKEEQRAGVKTDAGLPIGSRFHKLIMSSAPDDDFQPIFELLASLKFPQPPQPPQHPVNNVETRKINCKMIFQRAAEGWIYAQKMATAIRSSFNVRALLIASLSSGLASRDHEIVHELAAIFRSCCDFLTGSQLLDLLEHTNATIKRVLNANVPAEVEIDARIAWLGVNMGNMETDFVAASQSKFPEEVMFWLFHADFMLFKGTPAQSYEQAELGLERFPDNYELAYARAEFFNSSMDCDIDSHLERVIKFYERFLEIGPKDHRKMPEAYYQLSFYNLMKGLSDPEDRLCQQRARELLQRGQMSEAEILPWFLPYESDAKKHVEILLAFFESKQKKKGSEAIKSTQKPTKSQPSSKAQVGSKHSEAVLTNPSRIMKVLDHRREFAIWKTYGTTSPDFLENNPTHNPPGTQPQFQPICQKQSKPIALKDIDGSKDRVFTGRHMKFTCIEDGIEILYGGPDCVRNKFSGIRILVEDEKGDTVGMSVYGPQEILGPKLVYGTKLTVYNPNLKAGLRGRPWIRVDHPDSIVYHDEKFDPDRCRHCGKGGADFKCSKCRRAKYCTKECQAEDWKTMKHSLVCQ